MAKIISISPNEPEGRHVTLGRVVYHFKPNEKGHNVCDVTDEAHAQRLLEITEGYRVYEGVAVEPPAPPPIVKPIGRRQVPDEGAEPVEPKGPDYNGMTRKQLEAAYEEKFGEKPHPRTKDGTLLARLIEG